MLYFGFGSNLDRRDLSRWLAEKGHHRARLTPRGPAWLPDHELAFHYHSRPRGGGAADVRERVGAAVPGALFECDEAAWAALDHKEGGGRTYERRRVVVLDAQGEEQVATTYRVTDAYRQDRHVPPTPEYVAIVERGLRALGHPIAHLESAARSLGGDPFPDAVFVYGTLLRGELRAPLLDRHGAHAHAEAEVPGALVDLGEYPGLVAGPGRVRGELVRLGDPEAALAQLDEVEDFLGYGRDGSMYRRVVLRARRADGSTEIAWTYRYLGPPEEGRLLESGDWRRR